MRGLWGLERNATGERHIQYGRAVIECHLHAELHRDGWQRQQISDDQRQRSCRVTAANATITTITTIAAIAAAANGRFGMFGDERSAGT